MRVANVLDSLSSASLSARCVVRWNGNGRTVEQIAKGTRRTLTRSAGNTRLSQQLAFRCGRIGSRFFDSFSGLFMLGINSHSASTFLSNRHTRSHTSVSRMTRSALAGGI